MSELSANREFGPENQEADQATINLFENAIHDAIKVHGGWFDPSMGGGCALDIDGSENDSVTIEYRVPGASPPIIDWMFKEEIPHATAHWLRLNGLENESSDHLTLHGEVEEIWITQLDSGKQIRRRIYDPMYFNYFLDEKVDSDEFDRLARVYDDKRVAYLERIRASDIEEGVLGLNRVTNQQIQDYINLLKSMGL